MSPMINNIQSAKHRVTLLRSPRNQHESFWNLKSAHKAISSVVEGIRNFLTLARLGNLTCTPALRPVPRLEGQVRIYPKCWFHIYSCPWRLMSFSTSLRPLQKRSNTALMLPPFSMEMTRVWSSSLIQTRKFLSLLWKIPRASGQSRAIPAHVRSGETGLSNRKWSSINCCCSAAVMPFSG